jgi:hypothetical protein
MMAERVKVGFAVEIDSLVNHIHSLTQLAVKVGFAVEIADGQRAKAATTSAVTAVKSGVKAVRCNGHDWRAV